MLSLTAETREAWALFAKKFGAEHICTGETNRNKNNDSVIYDHRGTLVILDLVVTMDSEGGTSQTRVYAALSAKKTFGFKIYASNFLERVANLFGAQNVGIGDEAFDKKFIVKTNDVKNVRLFLSNPNVRRLIWSVLPNGLFSPTFEADWKKGETEVVSINQPGVVTDVERLELMFQLIVETIDHLIAGGLVSGNSQTSDRNS